MVFILTPDRPELRLKSYKSHTVNGKTTLTITCEITDHFELSYALRGLDDVSAGQKAAEEQFKTARAMGKTKAKPAPLALPAPQRALPRPEDAA